MAKTITRIFQGLFGTTDLGNSRVAQFGSLKGGTPAFASDASQIQTSEFSGGWLEAVIGQNYPAIEDRNALDYLLFYQLCYLFQQGIPEYDSTTTYYQGSFVSSSGAIYSCVNDNSGAGISGQSPTNATYWSPLVLPSAQNALLNGAFDLWQRGTSITIPYNGSGSFTYGPDRWAGWNKVGSGGVITLAQVSGQLAGSVYGLQASVTTAPGSGIPGFGAQLFQILDVTESQAFYNQGASFGINIKAVGNVTQVQIGFVYATSATGVAPNLNPTGTAQNFTVNSSSFTLCQLFAQAIGTAMTTSGVVGISIRVTAVSSGNTYDSGNGFIVEQAMMTPFGLPTQFSRQFPSQGAELMACQRYYESSYGNSATLFSGNVTSGSAYFAQCNYKAVKRFADVTNPPVLTNVNNVSFSTSTSLDNHTIYGFRSTRIANATSQGLYEESFTADAEIY